MSDRSVTAGAKHPICPDCGKPCYVNQSIVRKGDDWKHRNCHLPPTRIIHAHGPVPPIPRTGGKG